MFVTNPIGIVGEDTAADLLRKQGFKILERNWRLGHFEVDIIAKDNHTIVFAEVKARTTTFGDISPEHLDTEEKLVIYSKDPSDATAPSIYPLICNNTKKECLSTSSPTAQFTKECPTNFITEEPEEYLIFLPTVLELLLISK